MDVQTCFKLYQRVARVYGPIFRRVRRLLKFVRQHSEINCMTQWAKHKAQLWALAELRESNLPKMNCQLALFHSVCKGVQFNFVKNMLRVFFHMLLLLLLLPAESLDVFWKWRQKKLCTHTLSSQRRYLREHASLIPLTRDFLFP